MGMRFSEQARQAIAGAQEHARDRGHRHIGSEHLLLSLLELGEGNAASVLEQLGIDRKLASGQVQVLAGRGRDAAMGPIPFDRRAKNVLRDTLREAVTLGHLFIGAEHMLLALLRKRSGIPHRVLAGLGADPELARPIVARLVAEAGPPVMAEPVTARPARRWGRLRGSS